MTSKERRKLVARVAKQRGLTSTELLRLGTFVDAEECAAMGIRPAAPGFRIDLGDDNFVVRYNEPQRNGQRYGQRAGAPVLAYYCPLFDWAGVLDDPNIPIAITEGAFKGAAGCKAGLATIALGGVFNFASKRLKQSWIPSLDKVTWKDRVVYIVFDSDAVTNPMVLLAETRLAFRLSDRGAIVHIVRLPPNGSKKVGLDDYIANRGVAELRRLHDESVPWNKDDDLHRLNDEVVYVRRINAVVDVNRFQVMRPRDFVTDVYANWRHKVSTGKDEGKSEREVSTAQEWMRWSERRTVEDLTIAPGQPLIVDKNLNLWRGWPTESAEGDVGPFLDLIEHTLNGLSDERKHWFLQWLAYPIQHPGVKLRTAVMMHGIEQGTGKTLLGETIAALYGEAGRLIGQEQLEREFNEYMDCALFAVGDEVTTRGNRRDTAERLKNLITRPYVTVNKKYQPVYNLPNVAQFYLTSNHDDALYLEDKDRRFFVHRVEAEVLSPTFTKQFAEWQEKTNWRGALLYYLIHKVDCSAFDPFGAAPTTEAKQDMIATGLSDIDNWVRQLPDAPVHPDSMLRRVGPLHTAEELRTLAFGKETRCSLASVGLAMRKAGFRRAHSAQQVKVDGRLIVLWPTEKGLGLKQLATLIDGYREQRSKLPAARRFYPPGAEGLIQ